MTSTMNALLWKTEQEHKEEFNEQLHQEHLFHSKGGEYTQENIISLQKLQYK